MISCLFQGIQYCLARTILPDSADANNCNEDATVVDSAFTETGPRSASFCSLHTEEYGRVVQRCVGQELPNGTDTRL